MLGPNPIWCPIRRGRDTRGDPERPGEEDGHL